MPREWKKTKVAGSCLDGPRSRWFAPMRIIGHIDSLDGRDLRGWARDKRFPNRRLAIDVFSRGIFLGQTLAGLYRPDLVGGSADGFHGFRMPMPPDIEPVSLEDFHARVSRHPRTWLKRPSGAAAPSWSKDLGRNRIDRVYGPMIDALKAPAACLEIAPSARPVFKTLFDQAPAIEWPLSAFAWHIANKFGRAGDGSPTRAWYETFVAWYLSTYAFAKAPDRLPLSRDEIASWSTRSPAGEEWAATLLSRDIVRGPWGDQAARAVWMEDCLVEMSTLVSSRAPAWLWDRWRVFPVSRFMARFMRENGDFARLSTVRAEDRQRLYALIMLQALRRPHILAFLPSDGLCAMLDTSDGESPFARTLARACPQRAAVSAADYARQIHTQGFDVVTQSWSPLRQGLHRSSNGLKPVGSGVFDLQIIGPFRKTLGLAQSCRRLAWMASRLNFSVNFVDYDLGNASAMVASPFALGPPSAARVNVLHLNLEEIPEAIAFMPDVFSSAYNIAFPYWELNAPSACHRLGLNIVDEVWAPSTFLETVFRPHARITTSIGMCIDPSAPEASREEGRRLMSTFGIEAEDFVFLAISDALSWVQRKNVLGVVETFLLAHPEEPRARLIVKTHNLSSGLSQSQNAVWARIETLCEGDPRIVLVNETFDAPKQAALLQGADCLVSLHRAEGLGLDILEAMRFGVAVITTAYGGVNDACNADTSWLVDFDLVPVPSEDYAFVEPGHVWADPCRETASQLMREVMRDAASREQRRERGQERIAACFDPDIVGERIKSRLLKVLCYPPLEAP